MEVIASFKCIIYELRPRAQQSNAYSDYFTAECQVFNSPEKKYPIVSSKIISLLAKREDRESRLTARNSHSPRRKIISTIYNIIDSLIELIELID